MWRILRKKRNDPKQKIRCPCTSETPVLAAALHGSLRRRGRKGD
jgi:hypothetical protein